MSDQELINEMVAVYRDLNMKVRGLDFNAIASKKADNGDDLETVLRRMRNREHNSSQAIKLMTLGESASEMKEDENPDVLDAHAANTPTPLVLLSQFGNAREATLSMLRTMEDETWDAEHGTPRGTMSIRQYCRALVNDDREDEKVIDQLVEKAPA